MKLALPSGARVELGVGDPIAIEGCFGAELRGIRARFSRPLAELPLADLHSLRAVLRRLGQIPERPLGIVCSNCHHTFEARPSSALELGPYLDAELEDPELDAAFDFDRVWELGESRARLAAVSVSEAAPLHRALRAGGELRIGTGVVRGMGLVELDGERDPRRIARAVQRMDDATFDELRMLFEDAHYPARLDVPHPCPECGATEWLSVPLSRELSLEPESGSEVAPPPAADFMDVDEFEALVREEAARLWRELQIGEISLTVVEGMAAVDDGGEPLLGSYLPADPDALVPQPAEIEVFYRTFANLHALDGAYDVRAEVAETLRHELTHHLNHLSGVDPLDDTERDAIDHEHARRVGRTEVGRRATRAARRDVSEFFARTWYVWLVVAIATLLAFLADRR